MIGYPCHADLPPLPFRVSAVLFDFDGTLTCPGALDLPGFGRDIGCPEGRPVLEYIAGIEDRARHQALALRLEEFELAAAADSRPNAGAEEAVLELTRLGLPLAILSRNGMRSILRALDNFPRLSASHFRAIISRDDPVAPKPAPDGVLLAARTMGVPPAELAVVGDYVLDLQAARAAGALGIHLRNHGPQRPQWRPHLQVADLACLPDLISLGLPLPAGKLPARYLETLFAQDAGAYPPELVVPPGVGEDVAVVQLDTPEVHPAAAAPAPERFLALTADPITFATSDAQDYLLAVNANDLVTAGACPRWFLATVLLPPGTTPSQALYLLSSLRRTCTQAGVALVGGHTEITDAVIRPVLCGCLAGTATTLLRKDAMRPGDRIFLTKRLAIEGTALLARELDAELRVQGLDDQELQRARAMLRDISIVPEATVATAAGGVSALHDVTEGGLAEALAEFSRAGGHRLLVETDRIPVDPLCARICRLLGIDPLGLIGSGSLLLTLRPAGASATAAALAEAGIEATEIGCVGQATAPGEEGVTGFRQGRRVVWPHFPVDEAARVLAGR